MNVFNRIFMILLMLALLVAAVAVLIVTLGVVEPAQLAPTAWLQDRLEAFTTLTDREEVVTSAICASLILLGLILLSFELKPSNDDGRMTLTKGDRGDTTVKRDGIAALANHESMQVPGVMESDARVKEENGRVRIRERVSVARDVPIVDVSQAVRERVTSAVEQHVGRPVVDVRVDAQLQPLDGKGRVR